MKEIIVNNNTYLFVEVPNNAYDFEMRRNNQVVFLLKDVTNPFTGSEKSEIIEIPNIKFGIEIKDLQIISTTKDITEEQAGSIVESIPHRQSNYDLYKNYNNGNFIFGSAKESLQSLIQANGLDINKNYLILKKL